MKSSERWPVSLQETGAAEVVFQKETGRFALTKAGKALSEKIFHTLPNDPRVRRQTIKNFLHEAAEPADKLLGRSLLAKADYSLRKAYLEAQGEKVAGAAKVYQATKGLNLEDIDLAEVNQLKFGGEIRRALAPLASIILLSLAGLLGANQISCNRKTPQVAETGAVVSALPSVTRTRRASSFEETGAPTTASETPTSTVVPTGMPTSTGTPQVEVTDKKVSVMGVTGKEKVLYQANLNKWAVIEGGGLAGPVLVETVNSKVGVVETEVNFKTAFDNLVQRIDEAGKQEKMRLIGRIPVEVPYLLAEDIPVLARQHGYAQHDYALAVPGGILLFVRV